MEQNKQNTVQYTGCYSITDGNCVKMYNGDTLVQTIDTVDQRLRYLEQPYRRYVDEMKRHGTI